MIFLDAIILQGVKTHNLKDIDFILPHKKLYVISGVSGSGKSSFAFDTLYAEGQRRFVESLSSYARQFLERMERPDVRFVSGIPPAIAIEAKNIITNARSTVGTQTEVNDYLRLFFARVGKTICPTCHVEVTENQPHSIAERFIQSHDSENIVVLFRVPLSKTGDRYLKAFLPELEKQGFSEFYEQGKRQELKALLDRKQKDIPSELLICVDSLKSSAANRKRMIDSIETAFRYGKGEIQIAVGQKRLTFSEGLRCVSCSKIFRKPTPNLFSFNSPLGACVTCQGFGRVITIDWNLVIPDEGRSIQGGAIEPWTKPSAAWEFKQLLEFCRRKKIPLSKPWKKISKQHRKMILEGAKGDEYTSVQDFFDYLQKKTYKMHIRIFLAKYRGYIPCPDCHETRLKPEAQWVQYAGKTVHDLQQMSLEEIAQFFDQIKMTQDELNRVEPVLLEIRRRIRFLNEVGLGYLSLSRLSRTLSGGEVQRIHLATSLGSALVDTLYVLDEPSIGLHERDNRLLIRLLHELRDLGNTVVVVEHDRTMIEAADEVIDFGPLGGERGGEVLFQGLVEDLRKVKKSLTGQYLSGNKEISRQTRAAPQQTEWIQIQEASEHNLKNIDVRIPLRQFVVLTGVSGSGKSTLLYDVLYHHYLRYRGRSVSEMGKAKAVKGFEHIDEMVLIDQSPIGRTPRSNPATYIKAYDEIRKAFSKLPQARRQGFEARHFSFNVDGGRCSVCKGDGRIKVEMHFLADVFIPCEACQAKRFKPEILEIRYEGKNIDDVLGMSIDDAMDFFQQEKMLVAKLLPLQKVGLGYLRLGQSATTLSGGEAQRLKLASEMTERQSRHILYLFDEPTTGLHYHDIHYLMQALDELLSKGHSLVMIEHNLEVIRAADYLIDLGPEGGAHGGEVLYSGPTKGIHKIRNSHTGQCLREYEKKNKQAVGA